MKTFELTEDHIKLMRRVYMQWDDGGYDGAPCVNLKRPYGNSYVSGDIAVILGWREPMSDVDLTEEQEERAMEIHQQMHHAIEIVLYTGAFELGTYQRGSWSDDFKWKKL